MSVTDNRSTVFTASPGEAKSSSSAAVRSPRCSYRLALLTGRAWLAPRLHRGVAALLHVESWLGRVAGVVKLPRPTDLRSFLLLPTLSSVVVVTITTPAAATSSPSPLTLPALVWRGTRAWRVLPRGRIRIAKDLRPCLLIPALLLLELSLLPLFDLLGRLLLCPGLHLLVVVL